jgi:eukaryotic-like serine/threonine-protein kinase
MSLFEPESRSPDSSPLHRAFCPEAGLVGDSSEQFQEAQHCLMRQRLKMAAFILFVGFTGFLARNFTLGMYSTPMLKPLGVGHALLTVLLGVIAFVLHRHAIGCRIRMAGIELLIFGAPTVFFVWLQHCRLCDCATAIHSEVAAAYPAETVVPWIILINLYALFVPNTLRRAVVVVCAMAMIPIAGAIFAAFEDDMLRRVLFGGGGFAALLLTLGISGVIAIYGSQRIGKLRREVFDAQHIGAYALKRKLGAGGMGEVYLAEHRLLKRPCAIKLIRSDKAADATAIARFESEVQATARLTHQNTVEIYDYGFTQDGTFYYVMEYLPGMDLQQMIERFGPLPPARLVYLLRQVCSALVEAHESGLIHRDIKPGNIFVTERGRVFDVVKLLDFGLVKSIETSDTPPDITIEGAVIGSPMYAPPERVTGDGVADARGDLYSLGATAFFLLTGRPMFRGPQVLKILFAHANEPTPRPSDFQKGIPAELEAIVLRCLEKKPGDRFQTVAALEAALSALEIAADWTAADAHEWWLRQQTDEVGSETTPASHELETQVVSGRA